MSDNSSTSPPFDPWTDGLAHHGDEARPGKPIHVEVIEDVVPLDRQFGIWPKRCVPLMIEPALFGPDMHHDRSFALLDAAMIEGLQERLEGSDLPHVCLFQGKALEDWGHAAPWLVELHPQHDLTRDLFTHDRDGGLWGRNAALYLRSALDLTQLRDFLRKFSRIRDASGRWIQFRF